MDSTYIKPTETSSRIANQLLDGFLEGPVTGNVTYTDSTRVKSFDDIIKSMMEQMEGAWLMSNRLYEGGVFRPQIMRTKDAARDFFVTGAKKHMKASIDEGISSGKKITMVFLPVQMAIWKLDANSTVEHIMQSYADDAPFDKWVDELIATYKDYHITPELRCFINDGSPKSFIMPIFGIICCRKSEA